MNKGQRKKLAKNQAMKTGTYTPRNTFRSTMSIKSTLFDPNHPKNEKMVLWIRQITISTNICLNLICEL